MGTTYLKKSPSATKRIRNERYPKYTILNFPTSSTGEKYYTFNIFFLRTENVAHISGNTLVYTTEASSGLIISFSRKRALLFRLHCMNKRARLIH